MLSGCMQQELPSRDYHTTVDEQDIAIAFPAGTRSEGTITSARGRYRFSYAADGTLTIVYPNEAIYTRKTVNGGTAAFLGLEDSAEELGYIEGFSLAWAIEAAAKIDSGSTKAVSPALSLLLLVVGALFVWKPETVWWLERGWLFKHAEASEMALTVYRGVGFIIILIGVISFFA